MCVIGALLALVIIYLAATTASICVYSVKDERCEADVAIVLGAAADDSGVSPVFRERINHAVTLYRAGYVGAMIITGGYGEGNTFSDAEMGIRYALECGVPADAIYTEDESCITEENLSGAKSIMEECGFDRAIIVSDPLHMKRAMLMAKDFGIDAYSSPTPTTMYRSTSKKLSFLAREEFFYIGYRLLRPFR